LPEGEEKPVPIGEYIPANLARFVIEGVLGGKTAWSEKKAAESATYACATCNKHMRQP
jgi:hypothetical protein